VMAALTARRRKALPSSKFALLGNSSNSRNNNNSRGTTNRISREISRRLEARSQRRG